MTGERGRRGPVGLDTHGLTFWRSVLWNPTTPELYELAIGSGEGRLAEGGSLAVQTMPHTGRSPNDKFVVKEPGSESRVWWGKVNRPIEEDAYNGLRGRLLAYLQQRDLYVLDGFAGAHPDHRLPLRVISESPWHLLFARTMFIPADDDEIAVHQPKAVVLHAPGFHADPQRDGTRTATCVALHLTNREILAVGTRYAGEIKKSIFTLMNDWLPQEDILPMHCSANVGQDGHVAIFFGLSGTGKTTLSTDPERLLIGDDEHAWASDGVFNIEGGCYAKVIGLSAEAEPDIYATTRMYGTVIENVIMNPATRRLDLNDDSITENTRAAYPLASIKGSLPEKRAGHPSCVIMLTADAFGVLPPISRLTREQAMYHFLAGYTAKVAGTEVGVTEPQATFSPCFGGPFLPQPPAVYAHMLGQRLEEHGATAWLINTGWTGGPHGVGHRMPIAATRAIVRSALSGALDNAPTRTDPVFGLEVPVHVEGVDDGLLDPRSTWADADAFDRKAAELAAAFQEHFAPFADAVTPAVAAAGPPGLAATPR
jgi:phosphoenolpyruvate carboxykinase (ATP)